MASTIRVNPHDVRWDLQQHAQSRLTVWPLDMVTLTHRPGANMSLRRPAREIQKSLRRASESRAIVGAALADYRPHGASASRIGATSSVTTTRFVVAAVPTVSTGASGPTASQSLNRPTWADGAFDEFGGSIWRSRSITALLPRRRSTVRIPTRCPIRACYCASMRYSC
jgi:hypothetical protein